MGTINILCKSIAFVSASTLLTSCGSSKNDIYQDPSYEAQITRTEYGIPHIKAADWGSLGYGHGYAYAQDNFCVLMKEIVYANGQSAEFMGPDSGDLNSDFIFQMLNGNEKVLKSEMIDPQPEYLKQLVEGYAQGMNRYLSETGLDKLPEGAAGCRNAQWVRSITSLDIWKYMRKIVLQGSSDNGTVRTILIDTKGPDTGNVRIMNTVSHSKSLSTSNLNEIKKAIHKASKSLHSTRGASNGIALGKDATQTGTGMLLGNPHQPWQGSGRWYQVHLTIPGEYDVMGATLQGLPMVGIGFNGNLAWTHTTSFANRFTLYELALNPDNPMQYRYNNEWRDISSETVEAKIKIDANTTETRQHTFYKSHYGPIVNLGSVSPLLDGWPMATGTVLSIRDANIDNINGVDQWVKMGQAQSMDQFVEALKIVGNPLFHTLAADRNGKVFYGDISAIPHLTSQQLDKCIKGLIGPLLAGASNNTILSLDGSDPDCEWGRDADSPKNSNLYGYNALPKFIRADYAANSNNSYWLSNADHPLTGFPVVMGAVGHENEQQFTRTQLTHQMIAARMNASDGLSDTPKFDLHTLQQLMYSNRVLGAEISMPDIQSVCDDIRKTEATPSDEQQRALGACEQFTLWDQHVNLDSRGAHVFTEFWKALQSELGEGEFLIIDNDQLWKTDFDAADPIHTPRGFDTSINDNHELITKALSEAVLAIEDAGLTLDMPFGEAQFFVRNNEQIPIHGGFDDMGVFGVIKVRLDDGGYQRITGGNSYIQTVTWDESACPIAQGILTHSQSTDPASPHYGDQTLVYADKGWIDLPFCAAAIKAAQIGETLVLKN